MSLVEFASKEITNFHEERELEGRMGYARRLAEVYGLSDALMVLFHTHPKHARMTVSERCRALGVSEEAYFCEVSGEGYKRFVADWERAMVGVVRGQALSSTSEALRGDRYTYSKDGEAMVNHQLEVEVLRGMASGPQVNVQVNNNNVWSEAKRLAGKG